MGRHGGIFPAIVGTFFLVLLSLIFAAPLGLGTAIYLTEYTRESRLTTSSASAWNRSPACLQSFTACSASSFS